MIVHYCITGHYFKKKMLPSKQTSEPASTCLLEGSIFYLLYQDTLFPYFFLYTTHKASLLARRIRRKNIHPLNPDPELISK